MTAFGERPNDFYVARCYGARDPMIGLEILIHPMEFKLSVMGPTPLDITWPARRLATEAARKIEHALIKFVETGGV